MKQKLSPYRMGWILVMFDLPVVRDTERKAATAFRNALLDDGYLMIQWSVYARPCVTYEQQQTHIERLKKITPCAGNVRSIFMTDAQWGKSITIVGPNYRQGARETDPAMPRQIEFWE